MRELLRLHLVGAGYDVALAEDGIAAGYAVLKTPPDLILCDIEMPHMSGLDLVAALRADPSLPKVPVIFLTSQEEGVARAKELGATAFITKPVMADARFQAVREALKPK